MNSLLKIYIVEQDSSLVMSSVGVNLQFANIALDKTIGICTNTIQSQQDVIEGISKEKFRSLLLLATKESYFISNEALYKQKDGVAIRPHAVPTLANAFPCFYERKWIEKCPLEFNPVCYRRHVDIFVLLKSTNHLEKFSNYFNTCHLNMSFSLEKEKKPIKCPFQMQKC